MPEGQARLDATAGPHSVTALLAAITRDVDAVAFDRVFQAFPTNQSGNAVLLGIGIGIGNRAGSDAWRPALAIVEFDVRAPRRARRVDRAVDAPGPFDDPVG
jgi:uncharacterized membrane protein YoaK (UPF0700 family)